MPTGISRLALEHLRAHRRATLLADNIPHRLLTAIHPAPPARLIVNAPLILDNTDQLVVHIPEENPGLGPELELLAIARPIDHNTDAATDRWQAAHGTPRWPGWYALDVEAARFKGTLIDPDDWSIENPFAAVETAILRAINADRAALGRLVGRHVATTHRGPVAIAADPDGVDVRTESTVLPLRLDWPQSWRDAPDAERWALDEPRRAQRIAAWLAGDLPHPTPGRSA